MKQIMFAKDRDRVAFSVHEIESMDLHDCRPFIVAFPSVFADIARPDFGSCQVIPCSTSEVRWSALADTQTTDQAYIVGPPRTIIVQSPSIRYQSP